MGAPRKNTNASRHGLLIQSEEFLSSDAHARVGITLKKMPPGCRGIGNKLRHFFNAVEQLTLSIRKQLGPWEWCRIQSATHGLQRYELCQRWLAENKDLTLERKLALLREAAAGLEQRDRALQALGLDRLAADDGGLDGLSIGEYLPSPNQTGQPDRLAWPSTPPSGQDDQKDQVK